MRRQTVNTNQFAVAATEFVEEKSDFVGRRRWQRKDLKK